jgi:hypothetical protein
VVLLVVKGGQKVKEERRKNLRLRQAMTRVLLAKLFPLLHQMLPFLLVEQVRIKWSHLLHQGRKEVQTKWSQCGRRRRFWRGSSSQDFRYLAAY